jgi:threonine dehydratase
VSDAQRRLAQFLPRTRLVRAGQGDWARGDEVHLKLESDLPTGSFKVRGALYALSVNLERRPIREVVAASTGNHGAAVAFAAEQLGARATIFLPEHPNPVKARTIERLGARLFRGGADLSAAIARAREYADDAGAYFMQDTIDPDIPIGAGTIAEEILDALPAADAIYVPVGDSALIRGVAAAARRLRPTIRIVGVQAERAPSYQRSWTTGEVVTTETADTIADGLATREPIAANVDAIRRLVDDMRLVSEAAMLAAIRSLLFDEHVVAEPAGAAALAAYAAEPRADHPRKVVLLVTGSNIAPDVLERAVCL